MATYTLKITGLPNWILWMISILLMWLCCSWTSDLLLHDKVNVDYGREFSRKNKLFHAGLTGKAQYTCD